MAKQSNQEQHVSLSQSFQKMNDEVSKSVLHENLQNEGHPKSDAQVKSDTSPPRKIDSTELPEHNREKIPKQSSGAETPAKPLNFTSTDPVEEGRLRHFLRQLARLCNLRGDIIPRAQESLLQKFFLNRRDRHHLQQMSHAHALRSEEALKRGNANLSLLERIEAWRKMPRDLSLLLDVAEAYIEPGNFAKERTLKVQNARASLPGLQASKSNKSSKRPEAPAEPVGSTNIDKGQAKQKRANAKQHKNKAAKRARKQNKKNARQLFQLNAWQYRRQSLNYLKKAVELSIGLETENQQEGGRTSDYLSRELARLQKLQQNYPSINWEHYTEKIRALQGRPRRRWPQVILVLFVLALSTLFFFYLPWRNWLFTVPERPAEKTVERPKTSEQTMLNTPVPVEWSVPPEQDQDFDRAIQKSQRFKLNQHYVYEVQGHIRLKPGKPNKNGNGASANLADETGRWKHLQAAPPFDLLLTYEHKGQKFHKQITFSYGNDSQPNEAQNAQLMRGDTVLFRQVFRLPDGPSSDDRLRAQLAKVGEPAPSRIVDFREGGFAQPLQSIDRQGNPVPNLNMAFREKVQIDDGQKVRLLGYDLELQNSSKLPLDEYELQLIWRQEDGIRSKENSPVLLERNYQMISASGSNLPGQSRTVQRLWLQIPEDLNYAVEQLTPQVRIVENRFAAKP